MSDKAAPDGIRIDLWLWAARFFKTRPLCRQAIENGKVQVNGQRPKVSRRVRVGDRLGIERAGEQYELEVLELSDQRGPASVAQALYAELDASKAAREEQRDLRRAAARGYLPPEQKPDKRARRLIRALGDLDLM